MARLRTFRHSVSILKKQGIISKSAVDARGAIPTMKVKGKSLRSLVAKFDDVISGKVTAVKVPPKQLTKLRKAGFESASGRILIPHGAQETARLERGEVVIRNKSGIERIQIPIDFQNLPQYLRDIERHAPAIDRLKRKAEWFGIRFAGGQRANFYSDIRLLIADLRNYETVLNARSRYKQQEVFDKLEIVRMTDAAALRIERQQEERKRKNTKKYNRMAQKKYQDKIRRRGFTGMLSDYHAREAERMREYRASLKGQKKRDYKAKAKKRAKDWQKKIRGKR